MSINSNRSDSAKISGQHGGLHNQRKGGKSIKLQDGMIQLAKTMQGYTIDQLSWIQAGFQVDDKGVCQPSGLYSQIQTYFNAKRRGSEIAFHPFKKVKGPDGVEHVTPLSDAELKQEHPHAALVYCEPTNNPYTEKGGRGVRLLGKSVIGSASRFAAGGAFVRPDSEQSVVGEVGAEVVDMRPKVKPAVSKSVAHSFIGNMRDMLDD